jgi:Ketopantoate reductase PanE/ApbA C terminal
MKSILGFASAGALILQMGIASGTSGAERPPLFPSTRSPIVDVELKNQGCWRWCGRSCRGRDRRRTCAICIRECKLQKANAREADANLDSPFWGLSANGTKLPLMTLFEAAKGVEVFAVADIVQRMWEKLVHLSTAAAMTCLMRANVGEIVRTPYGRELFLNQLRCGAAIAAANGHAPSATFMKSWEPGVTAMPI